MISVPGQQHEQQAITDGRFFDAHKPELHELFTVLGMEADWSENLDKVVEVTQPWVKGDHFKPEHKLALTPEQSQQARELYRQMGMVDAWPLPSGEYDQIVVLGGTQRANNVRIKFLEAALQSGDVSLAEQGSVVLWGGQRAMFDGLETPYVANSFKDIQAAGITNPWLENYSGPLSETELLRLSALQHLGNFSVQKAHLRFGNAEVPISRYELAGEHGTHIVLLNTPAVVRPNGEPRHTTEACTEQWLEEVQPPIGAKIGFISGNPYLERTARVVQDVLTAHDRADIDLVPAGPAAYSDPDKDYLFLGEIARNIYLDQTH